jgi:hypothetical protein
MSWEHADWQAAFSAASLLFPAPEILRQLTHQRPPGLSLKIGDPLMESVSAIRSRSALIKLIEQDGHRYLKGIL